MTADNFLQKPNHAIRSSKPDTHDENTTNNETHQEGNESNTLVKPAVQTQGELS